MLFIREGERLKKIPFSKDISLATAPVWIDLPNMTKEEEAYVEQLLGLSIPSREEMHEIEVSSRLYHRNGAAYMTASLMTRSDTLEPEIHAVTFIVTDQTLVTIRYCHPRPFQDFTALVESLPASEHSAAALFGSLTDSIIDRLADILERAGHNLDAMTRHIFRSQNHSKTVKTDYQEILEKIGREGDLISSIRESLVTLNRMIAYALQSPVLRGQEEAAAHLSILGKDVTALSDHAGFLSGKLTFLLDATLGMLSIEQSNIIKIFSVVAVVFLPPTLIASIYGMNFDLMPELRWPLGYPLVLLLMALSSWLPYQYFKHRKWL